MQFLRENKSLFYVMMIVPLFFFYIDMAIISWIRDFQQGRTYFSLLLDSLDPFINFVSNGVTLIVSSVAIYVTGLLFNKKLRNVGRSLCIGFISAGIISQVLKHLIGRARPRFDDNLMFIGPSLKGGYDSFPSGHTTVTFCLAYILSQYYPRYRAAFFLFAAVTGIERIEGTAHFPSDVLAGAIVGLIVGKILSAPDIFANLYIRDKTVQN